MSSTTLIVVMTVAVFFQMLTSAIGSRARNRGHMLYQAGALTVSNVFYLLTFKTLIDADVGWMFFVPHSTGSVLGSLAGTRIAIWIERKIGASADGHLRPVADISQ